MTTPIFKENGSVDVDLLRDETKRMAAAQANEIPSDLAM
jgi:hypothetical protein